MEEKRPVGRPSKYDPKYCEEIVEHMKKGYSKEASAALMGLCKTTIWKWSKEIKEFSNAIKKGESLSQLHWEKLAMNYMVEEYRGSKLNPAIWIFNMRNRFGWSDSPIPETEDEEELLAP